MQVITDIIVYLRRHGLLSPDELRYLERHGFAEPDDVEDLDALLADAPTVEAAEPDPLDALVDRAERKLKARPRRGQRARPAPATLGADEIAAAIVAAWPRWEAHLKGLLAFARLLGPVGDLQTALRVLRHASAESLEASVAALLRGGKPPLKDLWAALAFDGYWEGVVPPTARGPAVRSYRAILAGTALEGLGRYGRELRLAGFAHLYLLVQGQRATYAAIGRVLASAPALFDRRLFTYRGYDETCYWSLVYAFSALLPEIVPRPAFELHHPREPDPEGDADRAAWAGAMLMAGPAVTPLLARREDPFDFCRVLYCPASWDEGRYRPA